MIVHTTCRHYRGDLPCLPNKLRGKECAGCDEFEEVGERILIIKLGAPGDVLRTTALLPAMKRKWPSSEITWLTRADARDLLKNLPEIDRTLTVEQQGIDQVLGEFFDFCMNFDNEPLASSVASRVPAETVLGFRLDPKGRIVAANPEAEDWLRMALFDRLKQENRRTYQSHMRQIAGLNTEEIDGIRVVLTDQELERAVETLETLGFPSGVRPFAFNTGSGERWGTKRWPPEWFIELALLLAEYAPGKILLLGGPCEDESNRLLETERPDRFVYPGVVPLRHFMAVVAQCGLLVTADTLALHVGLGVRVPTVALFGPTSAPEIEGDRLLKVVAPVDCICCYLKTCYKTPFCMDVLTPEMVFKEMQRSGFFSDILSPENRER